MKKMLIAILAVGVMSLSFLPVAWAADVQGKVKSLDTAGRILTLEDGTRLVIPPTVQVEKKALQPGADVKASYDTMNGENVITAIKVQPATSK